MGDDLNLWMEQAIREAEKGSDKGEVPIGAVLVGAGPDGGAEFRIFLPATLPGGESEQEEVS